MICLGYKVKVYTVATAATQERKVGSGVYVENNGANIYWNEVFYIDDTILCARIWLKSMLKYNNKNNKSRAKQNRRTSNGPALWRTSKEWGATVCDNAKHTHISL